MEYVLSYLLSDFMQSFVMQLLKGKIKKKGEGNCSLSLKPYFQK